MLLIPQKPMEVQYTAGFQVHLPLNIYREMMHYVDKFDTECSWCGLVKQEQKDNDIVFTWYKTFLPSEQENTGTTTDIEADAVGRLVTRLVREDLPVEDLRGHGHSHVNMDVFHSGTDTDNYKTLQTGEWLVSLVMNKKGAVFASVHYYKPFKLDVKYVPCYVTMEDSISDPSWDQNVALVKKYNEDNKKVQVRDKGVVTRFYQGAGYGVDGYDYDSTYDLTSESPYKKEALLSKALLEDMILAGEYAVVGNVESLWRGNSQARIIDITTGRVLRVEVEVTDLRDATEKDYIDAQYEMEGADEPLRETSRSDKL
jgi:hypothetical protein